MDSLYQSDLIIDREWNEHWCESEDAELLRPAFNPIPEVEYAKYVGAWWAYVDNDVSFEEVGW